MKEYTDSGYKIQEFESFAEVANYIEKTPNLYEYSLTSRDTLYKKFYGVDSFDNMFDRIRYGDKVQTESFITELGDIESYAEQDTGIFMDVEGFAYDMGSVVSGEPECCLNFGAPESKQSINIYIDIGYCGQTSVEIINNRGYAIVKLINSLMSKGYILNIYVVHYIDAYSGNYAQLFKIPTDYLTLATIGYSCTTDFFRVVSWLLTAIQKDDTYYTGSGVSKPNNKIIKAIKERGDLYIPSGYTDERLNDCDKEEAEKLVTEYFENWRNKK